MTEKLKPSPHFYLSPDFTDDPGLFLLTQWNLNEYLQAISTYYLMYVNTSILEKNSRSFDWPIGLDSKHGWALCTDNEQNGKIEGLAVVSYKPLPFYHSDTHTPIEGYTYDIGQIQAFVPGRGKGEKLFDQRLGFLDYMKLLVHFVEQVCIRSDSCSFVSIQIENMQDYSIATTRTGNGLDSPETQEEVKNIRKKRLDLAARLSYEIEVQNADSDQLSLAKPANQIQKDQRFQKYLDQFLTLFVDSPF